MSIIRKNFRKQFIVKNNSRKDLDFWKRRGDSTYLKFNIFLTWEIDPDQAWKDYNGEVYPPYQRGVDKEVFIRGSDGEIEFGKVWPYLPGVYNPQELIKIPEEIINKYHAKVAFPDFFRESTAG